MLNPTRLIAFLLVLLLSLTALTARGAGLIQTDDGGMLEIAEHHVSVTMNEGIAVTSVTQVFRNLESRAVEGVFTFPVPANASLAGFSMWINDREMIGEVVEKQAAREIYTMQKAAGHDPGLLEQSDYRTFNFRLAPIAAHALQKVQVTYYQELDSDGAWTTYVYPLASNAQPVLNSRVSKAFDMTFDARSADSIIELTSPSHAKVMAIKQYSETYARASLSAWGGALDRDVVLTWRSADRPTSARLTAFRENDSDGYFRLTLKPAEQKARENSSADYIFLLDVSGSMRDDDKLGQSRGTLASLLELLTPQDEFDVLSFNTAPSAAAGRLLPANDAHRQQAGAFLASRLAHGGTDFNAALSAAYRYARPGRVLNIVLISDGLSEQNQIPALAKRVARRPAGSRILCVGVGNDVDRALLQQMADTTGGLAAFISAGDDFHRQAASLQRKLRTPAITEASVQIEGGGIRDVVSLQSSNLFDGVPVHIYGRYSTPGAGTVTLKGKLAGQDYKKAFAVDFSEAGDESPEIQRMWAWRRIDRLLHGVHPSTGDIDQVVWLGQQYSIATEYTSFIVLENDAEYGRWKIAQRNARRLTQDRDAQAQLSAQLDALRRKSPQGLHESVPVSAAAATPVKSAAAPSLIDSSSSSNRPSSGAATFHPAGGALDSLTGLSALALGIGAISASLFRRSDSRKIHRLIMVCVGFGSMLGLNGCFDRDASNRSQFAPLRGQSFVVQKDLCFADGHSMAYDYYVDFSCLYQGHSSVTWSSHIPKSLDDYKANRQKFRDMGIVGVLPEGVRIRIERMIVQGIASDVIVGRILDGEHKGKTIAVDILLEWPDSPPPEGPPPLDYRFDERYLRGCQG